MIEIKNDNLIIDKKTTPINQINMIQSAKGKLYFSNSIVEISDKPHDSNELYNKLQSAGCSNFVLIDNVIVNVANIESSYMKYFQYAGISIFQCNRENAEMYMLVLNCKNGRAENILYRSAKEAEKAYHKLDDAIIDFKTAQQTLN